MLLEAQGIVVKHGDLTAVREVSLQIEPGSIVCIVGPNGVGKTSLLEALAGVNSIAAGEVTFDGSDLKRMTPAERVRRGLVLCPEGRRLYGALTVADNLRVAHTAIKRERSFQAAVKDVIDVLPEVEQFMGSLAGQLSGGQQQLVAIARSLMSEPRLLLLDEPTLGLAPRNAERVIEVVLELNRRNVALLLVEEKVELASNASEATHVMVGGRIVLTSTRENPVATDDLIDAMVYGLEGRLVADLETAAERDSPESSAEIVSSVEDSPARRSGQAEKREQ